jgi:hypothetical protein
MQCIARSVRKTFGILEKRKRMEGHGNGVNLKVASHVNYIKAFI